jgi:hypothetical protein
VILDKLLFLKELKMDNDEQGLLHENNLDITLPVSEEDLQDITGSAYVGDHKWNKTDIIVASTVGGATVLGLGAVCLRAACKAERGMAEVAPQIAQVVR